MTDQNMELDKEQQIQNEEVDILNLTDEQYAEMANNSQISEIEKVSEPTLPEEVETQGNELNEPVNDGENPEESSEEVPELSEEDKMKRFYEVLSKPFKASGQTFKIEDPEKILELAQKGIDYTKKTQKLSEKAGMIKTLEESGLLSDEKKIQLAIDLLNKDPKAIAQLLKDSNIDTYSLPDLDEDPYQSQVKVRSNSEVELLERIEQYQKDPNTNQMLSVVDGWDSNSLIKIQENPAILDLMADDMNNGIFRDVINIINHDKTLGNIPQDWLEKGDLALYEKVSGDLIAYRKAGQSKANNQQQQIIGSNLQKPLVKAPSSAALPRQGTVVRQNEEIDFLNMDNETFIAYCKANNIK